MLRHNASKISNLACLLDCYLRTVMPFTPRQIITRVRPTDRYRVSLIFSVCHPFQVVRNVIFRYRILMVGFMSISRARANEGLSYELMNVPLTTSAIQEDALVSTLRLRLTKKFSISDTSYAPEITDLKGRKINYGLPRLHNAWIIPHAV